MTKKALKEPLKEALRQIILDYGAIRYVHATPKDGLFLIKLPGVYLEPDQPLGERIDVLNPNLLGHEKPSIPRNSCVIFDGHAIYQRGIDKMVEKCLSKLSTEISKAPEFMINNFFEGTVESITVEFGGPKKKRFIKNVEYHGDGLRPLDDIKIQSPKYFKPINDLLREIGLLEEKRGKEKSVDKIIIQLRKFIIKEFKSIKDKKPLPINILQNRLTKKVNEMFPDVKESEKYYWSDSTIRRIIEDSIKK